LQLGVSLNIFADPVLKKLAEKYKKTVAQIVLNYFWSEKVILIPKTVSALRLKENYEFTDFVLDEADK
jgi:diketogulonate reductase-like aldo/keto reductase